MLDFFTGLDWSAIFKIIGLDIMLGGDNAVVIALACAALPLASRNKAMLLGTGGAVAARALLLAIAGVLLNVPFLKLVAGGWLLYIGYQLLADHDDETGVESPEGMWAAVYTIIVADIMMSIDNVLAVIASAQSAGAHSTAYAVAGILFSIPIIILGAKFLTGLMDRFPIIIWFGAGLLGWVGAEMMITDPLITEFVTEDSHIGYKIAGFAAVLLAVVASRHFSKTHTVPEYPQTVQAKPCCNANGSHKCGCSE